MNGYGKSALSVAKPSTNEEAKAPDMAIDIIGCLVRAKDEAYQDYTTSLVAA
jgi:hypothetical protein